MVYVAIPVALLCLSWLPAALAHARVTSPSASIREPGPAFEQACGQTSFNAVQGDPTGHIEEQEPVNAGCVLTLCRGMLFSDQPATSVQTVQASQAMAMDVDCTVPHGGPANVSLIDTTTGGSGAFIGSFLSTFDDFCPTTGPAPADQTHLQYTLPDAGTIGNKCQTPGDCVVQLFWATPDFSQNYYYCFDVVMAAVESTTPAAAPATTAAAPATTPAASAGNAPAAPSKMLTSVTGNVAAATGQAAPTSNSNAGRRRARILWF